MKYEKVQRKNPHKVSVTQHVFPVKSIERFRKGKVVELHDLERKVFRNASPTDEAFVCKRLWDHASETGFMKNVEDDYQGLVDAILSGDRISIENRSQVITEFYSLWCSRSYISKYSNNGVTHLSIEGDVLSKDEEEKIESMNMSFLRSGGVIPERFINGVQAQLRYMHYCDLYKGTSWGLVQAKGIEFIVPDNFSRALVVPVTPEYAFIGGCKDGVAMYDDIIKVNEMAIASADSYLFCREFKRTA